MRNLMNYLLRAFLPDVEDFRKEVLKAKAEGEKVFQVDIGVPIDLCEEGLDQWDACGGSSAWSKVVPTLPGFYWFWAPTEGSVTVVEIAAAYGGGRLEISFIGNDQTFDLDPKNLKGAYFMFLPREPKPPKEGK